MSVVTVKVGEREGKVELWTLGSKKVGLDGVVTSVVKNDVSRAGSYDGGRTSQTFTSYYVAMREGGYLRIRGRRVSSWEDTKGSRSSWPTFDIWGGWYDDELTTGKDGEPYLLKRPTKAKAKLPPGRLGV